MRFCLYKQSQTTKAELKNRQQKITLAWKVEVCLYMTVKSNESNRQLKTGRRQPEGTYGKEKKQSRE